MSIIEKIHKYIIVLLLLIPASSFLGFRSVLIFLYFVTILWVIVKRREDVLFLLNKISLLLMMMIFVLLHYFYSIFVFKEFGSSHFDALVRYEAFFVLLSLLILSYHVKTLNVRTLLTAIFIGSLSYNVIKVLIISVVPLGLMSADNLVNFVTKFDVIVVPGYWSDNASFTRLSFGNDILNPFLLLFFLIINNEYRIYSKRLVRIYVIFSVIAALFSFTRSIWLLEILVIFYFYFYVKKQFFQFVLFSLAGISVLAYIAIYYPFFVETFYIRLFDSPSIDMKKLQADALIEQFSNSVVFGSGIGAFLPELIRHTILPYIYEVQLYALIMQFGVFGFSLFTVFFIWVVHVNKLTFSRSIPIYLFYLMWLLTGLTNPYLFILTSTFVYFLFYVVLREKPINNRVFVRDFQYHAKY